MERLQCSAAVLYGSRRGNTRCIAEAIADALGVTALPVGELSGPPRTAGLVFLGVPARMAALRPTLRSLAPALAGRRLALFCTAALFPRLALARLRRRLPGAAVFAQRAFRPPLQSNELAEVRAARQWAAAVCGLARRHTPPHMEA